MPRRTSFGLPVTPALALALALAAATACTSTPEGANPPTLPPTDTSTFQGVLAGQVSGLQGRPFGLGVSSSGAALVLQLDRLNATRVNTASAVTAGSVVLGFNAIDATFTADGSVAYVTLLDGARVYQVDMTSGAVVDSVAAGARHHRILMEPGDSSYLLLSFDGMVRRIRRGTTVVRDSATVGSVMRGISRRTSDGSYIVTGGQAVARLDGNTLAVTAVRSLNGHVQEAVHSADGSRVFVAIEFPEKVLALDANTLAPLDSLQLGNGQAMTPFGMRLTPDASTLLMTSPGTGRVFAIDPATLDVRQSVFVGGIPRRIGFSADGRRAFVTNEGGYLTVLR